jgi:hypothetical protein
MTTPPELSVSRFTISTLSPTRSVMTAEVSAITSKGQWKSSQQVAVTIAVWLFVEATGVGVVLGIISCVAFAKDQRRDRPWVLIF